VSSKTKIFIFLVAAPLLALSFVSIEIYYYIKIWKYDGPPIIFEIKPGQSFANINYKLQKQDLISNAKIFHKYAKFKDQLTNFKAGNYEIPSQSDMSDILTLLTSGKSLTVKITIPEGKNLYEIAKILEQKEITSSVDFIKKSKNHEFIKKLKINNTTTEGYLYPDTYYFSKNTSPSLIITTMLHQFNAKTKNLNFEQSNLTKPQIITLASIIEKETGAASERPRISGVFHNRLQKKMRLQSDPTTIYGIFEKFNGNLRKKHLLQKTPYNTYKISGLPIGPISNPGLASIKAALSPEKHNYLYFVSKNDGTHIFTKTYKEHSNAVDYWQKRRSSRKGKSWRNLKQ
jgi:UPF0755 protein